MIAYRRLVESSDCESNPHFRCLSREWRKSRFSPKIFLMLVPFHGIFGKMRNCCIFKIFIS